MLTHSVGLSEDRQQIKEESFILGKKQCWRKGEKGAGDGAGGANGAPDGDGTEAYRRFASADGCAAPLDPGA